MVLLDGRIESEELRGKRKENRGETLWVCQLKRKKEKKCAPPPPWITHRMQDGRAQTRKKEHNRKSGDRRGFLYFSRQLVMVVRENSF